MALTEFARQLRLVASVARKQGYLDSKAMLRHISITDNLMKETNDDPG